MVLQGKHFVALNKAIFSGDLSRVDEYTVDIINYQHLLNAILCDAPNG